MIELATAVSIGYLMTGIVAATIEINNLDDSKWDMDPVRNALAATIVWFILVVTWPKIFEE